MSEWDNQQGMTNFWQNEAQSRSNELAEKAKQAHDAVMGHIDADKRAQSIAAEAASSISRYEAESDYLVELGEKLLQKLNRTEAALEEAQAANRNYKALLARPMPEIAAASPEFAATYQAYNEMLANWIFSQRAYREVAMELGSQMGRSRDEVIAMLKPAKMAVLEGKTRHDNNAKDMPSTVPYIEAIKAKEGEWRSS